MDFRLHTNNELRGTLMQDKNFQNGFIMDGRWGIVQILNRHVPVS